MYYLFFNRNNKLMNEEMRTEDLFWVELKFPKKKHKA